MLKQPVSDDVLAQELAAIVARLAGFASEGGGPTTIGLELDAIRAHLRKLAEGNAEVAACLNPAGRRAA
jgi:hypothetical protein